MDPPVSHRISVRCGTQAAPPDGGSCLRDCHPLRSRFPPRSTSAPAVVGRPATPDVRDTWFGLLRVRSPLLAESCLFLGLLRCFSSPGSLFLTEVVRGGRTGFPHSEIVGCSRLHTADQRLSQCTTSFFGTGRPGIPRVPAFGLSWFDGEAGAFSLLARRSPDRPRASLLLLACLLAVCTC